MTQRIPFRVLALATLLPAALAACQQASTAYSGPYAKEVNAAIPAIEKSVGLKFKTMPKVESRSKDEVRAFLEKKFDEDQPALEMAGAERAYKLLGLLPDTLNLRKFLLKLLTEQVVGYYDPATKVLYVVQTDGAAKDGSITDIVRITITHELVHALQDQYVENGLESLQKIHGDNDRQTAVQSIMEGQATYEQLSIFVGGDLAMRMPGGWDRVRQMIRESQATMPVFATAPQLIQETLLFPYLSGAEFVRQFKEKHPGESPYKSMPTSTEQVLHPDRYLDVLDPPTRITLPKPNGGTVVFENNLGEFETRLFILEHTADLGLAARAASGWDGDRYYVVNTGHGAGIAWLTVWDSPMDAAEFGDAMERMIIKRFGAPAGSGGRGEARRFSGKGRTLELTATTLQGRPVVLFVDVPAGADTKVIDLAKVKLETP